MADPNFPTRYTTFYTITPSPSEVIAGPAQSDGQGQGYTGGIMTDTTGSIVAIGRHGATPVTLHLIAGWVYPFELKMVHSVSTPMNLIGMN